MGSVLSLISTKPDEGSLRKAIGVAIGSIGFEPKKAVKTVIIKPNLNYYWEASTGCTTDPRVVGALIDYLRTQYDEDLTIGIAEADASAMRTNHAFHILGYDKLADEKKVQLLNLSADKLEKERVTVRGHDIEFDVPQSLKKADLFINVPKLKIMRATKITCAMKNIFGCIAAPRKYVYHPILDEAIVGINKVLKPQLTIVDGLVALGKFPVKLNLLMASTDVFSVDWVVAQIAGYNPRRVRFLKIAMLEKIGNPHGILVCGENLKDFKYRFPREGFISQKWLWSLEFGLLHLYRRISGDVIPPFLEED